MCQISLPFYFPGIALPYSLHGYTLALVSLYMLWFMKVFRKQQSNYFKYSVGMSMVLEISKFFHTFAHVGASILVEAKQI